MLDTALRGARNESAAADRLDAATAVKKYAANPNGVQLMCSHGVERIMSYITHAADREVVEILMESLYGLVGRRECACQMTAPWFIGFLCRFDDPPRGPAWRSMCTATGHINMTLLCEICYRFPAEVAAVLTRKQTLVVACLVLSPHESDQCDERASLTAECAMRAFRVDGDKRLAFRTLDAIFDRLACRELSPIRAVRYASAFRAYCENSAVQSWAMQPCDARFKQAARLFTATHFPDAARAEIGRGIIRVQHPPFRALIKQMFPVGTLVAVIQNSSTTPMGAQAARLLPDTADAVGEGYDECIRLMGKIPVEAAFVLAQKFESWMVAMTEAQFDAFSRFRGVKALVRIATHHPDGYIPVCAIMWHLLHKADFCSEIFDHAYERGDELRVSIAVRAGKRAAAAVGSFLRSSAPVMRDRGLVDIPPLVWSDDDSEIDADLMCEPTIADETPVQAAEKAHVS
jgi:hypothetical protein